LEIGLHLERKESDVGAEALTIVFALQKQKPAKSLSL
jgi:hypothetical protein